MRLGSLLEGVERVEGREGRRKRGGGLLGRSGGQGGGVGGEVDWDGLRMGRKSLGDIGGKLRAWEELVG